MHFKNARNASVYAVFRAFFTQSLAKLRISESGDMSISFWFFSGLIAVLVEMIIHFRPGSVILRL